MFGGTLLATTTAKGQRISSAPQRDRTRVNVGYYGDAGRNKAHALATRRIWTFDFGATTIETDQERAHRLRESPEIKYVEPDWPVAAQESVLNYGITRINADVVHEWGPTGDGVHIGVVDTGIAPRHEALRPNLGSGKNLLETESGSDDTAWSDPNGHGTHCAGIIGAAGSTPGVCTDATVHAVRAIGADGTGRVSDVAKALEYIRDQGWEVANLSFACQESKHLVKACRSAWGNGTTLVAAAGTEEQPCPANDVSCLAVGAVTEDDTPAPFSPANGVADLVAPGSHLRSTVPSGFEKRSGTSMAAALVTGGIAVLLGRGYEGFKARQRVQETATELDLPNKVQGAGLLDLATAVDG